MQEYKIFFLFKDYICDCKSGKRIAGACVHVATVIYYLAYLKGKSYRSPGMHLNSVFINTSINQPGNRPEYIKAKRHSKSSPESEESLSSSDEESDDYPESVGSNNSGKEPSGELSTDSEQNLDEELDSIESFSSTFEDDYEDNNVNYQENHVARGKYFTDRSNYRRN